ncbi:unnamed protein product [Ectocarpus sp. 12 AP-2014]
MERCGGDGTTCRGGGGWQSVGGRRMPFIHGNSRRFGRSGGRKQYAEQQWGQTIGQAGQDAPCNMFP